MRKLKGILFGLTAGLLWGLDGVLLGKVGTAEILIITLLTACLHDGFAALWILFVNIKNKRIYEYINCPKSRQFIAVLGGALLGGPLGMTANITAISIIGASYACAVTSAYPVIGAVIGMILLKEKCSGLSLIGIFAVAAGAACIGFSPSEEMLGGNFYTGILLAVLAAVFWASEGALSKSCMNDISSDVLIGIREMISCTAYIMLIAIMSKQGISGFLSIKTISVILAASFAGAFSYLCWYRSMDISGAAVGMALNATYALWASVFDIFINHTMLSFKAFIGISIILTGTVLTIFSEKQKGYR